MAKSATTLEVLYEDNHLFVVHKPAGLATQGVAEGTASVLTRAKTYLKQKYAKPGNVYLGIVSRLDSTVSGALVLARTSKAADRLTKQFQSGAVKKTYWAIVEKPPQPAEGELSDWLLKDDKARCMKIVPPRTRDAQHARLKYRTLGKEKLGTLVEVELLTGRKHQIRLQLSEIGCSILGDRKYGNRQPFVDQAIALHCVRLELTHPTTQKQLTFVCPPPPQLEIVETAVAEGGHRMSLRDRLPQKSCDAIVIGSGPNGLAAAIAIAQQQRSVLVLEAQPTLGGGARTAELTLPGYLHDICSAIHPMALASPFLSSLPLADFGLQWIHPPAPLAHPLDNGTAAILERDIDATAATLGSDSSAYRRLMQHLSTHSKSLFAEALGPLRLPRHPILMAKFGLRAIRSAQSLANAYFKEPAAKALIAGLAGHSVLPLEAPLSAAVAMMLGISGHAVGWPVARGGSQAITNAMVAYLKSLGGEVVADCRVESLDELPPAKALLFDTSPSSLSEICQDKLPQRFRQQLTRFRHGPGVFKLDWALSQPIPWAAKECQRAATIHLGGTLEEITAAESQVHRGEHPDRPYVLVAQQSLFDDTRTPAGKHAAWAYCHVPAYSTRDMTDAIERQIERFAPGFRNCVLAKTAMTPADMQRHNANYIGGDISGGMMNLRQLFTRPSIRLSPYTTPNPQIFICSSSTPPGGGVHGMCGYFAAQAALKKVVALIPSSDRAGYPAICTAKDSLSIPHVRCTRTATNDAVDA